MTEEQPTRSYVGQILGMQPAVKRVSRRTAFRGYRVFVCAEIDENGKPTKQTEFFKPTRQYDRGTLSANRYTPHQGKQEALRRRVGGWALHKVKGEFYDPASGPFTKRATLASEWGRNQLGDKQ